MRRREDSFRVGVILRVSVHGLWLRAFGVWVLAFVYIVDNMGF